MVFFSKARMNLILADKIIAMSEESDKRSNMLISQAFAEGSRL